MANPGKSYDIKCGYQWAFGTVGDNTLIMIDELKYGNRTFRISSIPIIYIEVE